MVQHTIALIPQTPDQTTKLALIDTLIAITDGRIYVEVERAQLARLLAAIREASGDIPEAADILQALQVETFGSLSRTDKIDFILEQVRLLAAKGDYIRAGLAIRKISPRTFDRKASAKQKKDRLSSEQAAARVEAAIMTDLKLRYLQLQIVLAMHDEKFLDVCRFFRQIYDTVQHRAAQRAQGLLPAEAISGGDVEMTPAPGPGGAGASEEAALAGGAKALEPSLDPSHVAVSQLKPTRTSAEDDDQQWRQALANMVVFATLAPFDHEQSDMLHRVAAERRLSELPHSPDIIQAFTSSELIVWSQFASKFGEYLSDQHRFGKEAKFKLADKTEVVLAKLVANGTVSARIDRPAKLVKFSPAATSVNKGPKGTAPAAAAAATTTSTKADGAKQPAAPRVSAAHSTLNTWSKNVETLLSRVEETVHLIEKENMLLESKE
ncbi:hypothetical protein H696_02607 [Fonticula alba]|uniref:Uncharacterized protein n=1 Tax=Fonticula alba TaxID=691883 RepID=A0A058Z9R4_FONAL|nr:hypothetical protein H696_02607 [Fonticula alba]KCV70277.1 hypothetical protein H696_02607 [Fonticula alba]|eukprot:XP_009494793.1 hypothetical protein H696_02607 [Fonticula alba]